MKALIKKEVLETIGPVAVVFAGLCWFWIAHFDVEEVLIAPAMGTLQCVFAIATVFGAMLGYAQFAIERGRGTQNSAIHRAGGHRRLFFAKVAVGIIATIALALGPILIFVLWQCQNSPNAPLMQSQRLVEYALASLRGTLGWSVGVLASQLRRTWSGISFLTLGIIAACFATLSTWSEPGVGWATIVADVTTFSSPLVMTFGIGWLALRLFEGARDREIGLPSRQHALIACAGMFLFVLPAYGIASGLASLIGASVVDTYPSVVRDDKTHAITLMSRADIDEHVREARRDPTHRQWAHQTLFDPRQGAREPDGTHAEVRAEKRPRLFGFVAKWLPLSTWTATCRLSDGPVYHFMKYLDEDTGTIRVYWIEGYGEHEGLMRMAAPRIVSRRELPPALPAQLLLTKPGGAPFSSATFGAPFLDQDLTCIVDPEDRSLWKLDPFNVEHMLSPLSLPEGDRFVRMEHLTSVQMVQLSQFQWHDTRNLFVGEHGRYVWSAGRFDSFRPNEIEGYEGVIPSNDVEAFTGVRVRETDPDLIHPRVEVLDATDGTLLFAHTYAPESRWQALSSAGYVAFALLRSPVACIQAFATKNGVAEPTWLMPIPSAWELLFIGHKRPWLLFSILAVTAVCAYSIARRMQRQGAPPLLVAWIALLTVLGGVIAYLYLRALLPRRARAAEDAAPSPEVRELLIQSA